jgi:hypothetical protein
MIQKDLISRLAYKQVLQPTRQTNSDAAIVGAIQDMGDLIGFTYVIELGQLTDAGFTTVVLLEHGEAANLSDAVAVPDEELLPSGTGQEAAAAFTEANDATVRLLGYAGTKRYHRLTITPTGHAAGNIDISILGIGVKRFQGVGN